MRLPLAVLLVATVSLLVASTPLSVQESTFGAYNEDWDGIGHLLKNERSDTLVPVVSYEGTPARLLHGATLHIEPDEDGLLILGPETMYTREEVDRVRTFLQEGGRVLLAEDVGLGRDLVSSLDLGVQIPGTSIYTPAHVHAPAFPVALSTGHLVGMPAEVVFNRPSIVEGPGTPVLVTPEPSWLDLDGDLTPDLNEPHGRWALAMHIEVGQGELLVVGDPALFTEEMSQTSGPAARALLDWLVQGDRTLVIDEGHRLTADPLGSTRWLAQAPSGGLAVGLVLVGAAAVGISTFRVRLRRVANRSSRGSHPRGMGAIERAVLSELEAGRP